MLILKFGLKGSFWKEEAISNKIISRRYHTAGLGLRDTMRLITQKMKAPITTFVSTSPTDASIFQESVIINNESKNKLKGLHLYEQSELSRKSLIITTLPMASSCIIY